MTIMYLPYLLKDKLFPFLFHSLYTELLKLNKLCESPLRESSEVPTEALLFPDIYFYREAFEI